MNRLLTLCKEKIMRGSIRAGVGFLITFGAVGGIDNDAALIPCVLAAIAGLAIMASGVFSMKGSV
jgi:hypothetical protein